jgi:hypothetical protein
MILFGIKRENPEESKKKAREKITLDWKPYQKVKSPKEGCNWEQTSPYHQLLENRIQYIILYVSLSHNYNKYINI